MKRYTVDLQGLIVESQRGGFVRYEDVRERDAYAELNAADAARYRWWCRWWLDAKDDMERINDLEYEGDDQASMSAAIDAEIAKEPIGMDAAEPGASEQRDSPGPRLNRPAQEGAATHDKHPQGIGPSSTLQSRSVTREGQCVTHRSVHPDEFQMGRSSCKCAPDFCANEHGGLLDNCRALTVTGTSVPTDTNRVD